MNTKTIPFFVSIACGLMLVSSSNVLAADAPKVEFPAPSPAAVVKQHVGLSDVEVDYSRPGVKGREIFGGLVPYGQVWRTGANQATKIIFSTAVKLNGTEIPAGTYALMTIPDKDEWTIIINKGADQWGAYKYDEKADVARVKVKATHIERSIEDLTIEFNDIKDDSAQLTILWDKTKVPVSLTVDIVDKIMSQIDAVMSSDEKKKPYFQAAMFYFNHGKDLQKAKQWVDLALADRDAHYIAYLKAEILAKLGDKAGAIAAAKHSSELAVKEHDNGYVKLNADLISGLK